MICRQVALYLATACVLAGAASAMAQTDAGLAMTPQATARIERAVVYIHVEWKDKELNGAIQDSWGTGFFVSDTEVLTNHHVLEDAIEHPSMRITVRTHSGTRDTERYEAYLKNSDAERDLALLTVRAKPTGVSSLSIQADGPLKNSPVLGFGFPMGDIFDPSPEGPGVALRRGYVSRITHQGTTIEADMNIDHGMSGGPATSSSGLVIGMVTAMGGSSDNPNAFAFLISSGSIMAFLAGSDSRVQAVAPDVTDGGEPDVAGPTPGERPLRSYFSLGGALRIHTLVANLLAEDEAEAEQADEDTEAQAADDAATPDAAAAEGEQADGRDAPDSALLQVAQKNVENATGYLRELKAPQELLDSAERMKKLLDSGDDMARADELAVELEQACDEWVGGLPDTLDRLNYDFGAWLIEMKLGGSLIIANADKQYCSKFRTVAELQKAPDAVLSALGEIEAALDQMSEERTVTAEKTISRNAEALIAVGYLGPAGNAPTTAKPSADGDDAGRDGANKIRIPTP